MRCTRVEKFLPLYVAGDLAGRRAERRVTNHLATCERCRGLAAEYDASRNLVRAAATLPPDFDGAFYEELRSSVLAEIKRGRTPLAPPTPFAGFASLFNARFAYAASLALVFVIIAALSLHSYVGRKSEDAVRRDALANVNRERNATPEATATPVLTKAPSDARQTLPPVNEMARKTGSRDAQFAKSLSPPKRRAKDGNAQHETPRSVDLAGHTPSHAKRNPLAPVVAPTTARVEEIASSSSSSGATDAPEVSRIEMQTSDPNIRIIWLSPKPEDAVAQPLK